ncbi:MAG: multidrug efflux SMR transporter [Paracoccaceae bacterium]|jgi:small multidrug resistance pump|nr:multidrug efflux SMR transporter [Paracoccaceae bacterium]
MPLHYVWLVLAIVAETVGTTALQASQQFTRPGPSMLVVAAYATAFYLLSLVLKSMPVGVVYAVWSGLGVVFIAIIGRVAFGQRLDAPALLGIALILAGVLTIHLFSRTTGH